MPASQAVDVVHALETGTPSIRVRTHQLEHGSFVMDPRSLGAGRARGRRRAACARRSREARRNRGEAGSAGVEDQRANAHAELARHAERAALERGGDNPAGGPERSRAVEFVSNDVRTLAGLFLLPTVVVLTCVVLYPFAYALVLSFQDKTAGPPERFIGLQNYGELLGNPVFLQIF